MPSQTRPIFEQLDTWLTSFQDLGKQASAVKAATPGVGKTSHPSEKVDNNTHNAPEGERYNENSKDVKKDVPNNVDEAHIKADEDRVMPNIGTHQSATGEDPSVEDAYKSDKDDPGTSHPCNADDAGEKYSSVSLPNLLKMAENAANAILADIGNGILGKPAQAPPAPVKAAAAAAPAKPAQASSAPQVAVNEQQLTKQAAEFIEQTYRDAEFDADLVGQYLTSWRQKKASALEPGEPRADEGESAEESAEGGAKGGKCMPGPKGGAKGAPDDGGAGVMPPPPAPGDGPAAGGPMPGGPMPGGPAMPPDAGGGMPPMGGAPGGPGGDPMAALGAAANDAVPSAGDKQQAMQDLLTALKELGIDPQELADMSAGGPQPHDGAKLAAAATRFQRSGKYQLREPKTANERRRVDQIKAYVREVANLND